MKGLRDHIDKWRFNRHVGIGRAILPMVMIALGTALLTFGLVQTAFSVKTRSSLKGDVAQLIEDIADLEDAAFFNTDKNTSDGESFFVDAIPSGGVPGPILEEVLETLESVGIQHFEYRVFERLETSDASIDDGHDGSEDNYDDYDDYGEDEVWEEDDWEESEDESNDDAFSGDQEVEATPGLLLYQWKVKLVLWATYDRTVELLRELDETPRHWRISSLEFNRQGRALKAELLLETFTRPVSDDEEPDETGPVAFNNPFRMSSHGSSGAIVPAAPILRAIMSGTTPKAWLDEQIVSTGGSVANWTVEEIDDDGVWIRHRTGHRVRLSVEG